MPVRLGPMFKIIPSSSPSPRGSRDLLSLSLPHGRDGRETPVRAAEWVWERVGVGALGFLKLLLVSLAATSARALPGDRNYDSGPPAPRSSRLPAVRSGLQG